jgi:hypothetical protein
VTREQAEAERDRLAAEQPEATWLVAERDGAWQVVKVGLPARPRGTALEARPRPSTPDSPPPPDKQVVNPNWGWI